MMAGVRGINVYGKNIIWIDYEGCKTADQMIKIFDEAVNILRKGSEQSLVLTSFKNSYITSPFLRHIEAQTPLIAHLIKRNVFIGMSKPKKMILKGINQSNNLNYPSFDSEHEAIAYLIND